MLRGRLAFASSLCGTRLNPKALAPDANFALFNRYSSECLTLELLPAFNFRWKPDIIFRQLISLTCARVGFCANSPTLPFPRHGRDALLATSLPILNPHASSIWESTASSVPLVCLSCDSRPGYISLPMKRSKALLQRRPTLSSPRRLRLLPGES